jgi:hypothetical protein
LPALDTREQDVDLEIIDGEVWRIVRGKKAGVTPARPERRELWFRDPKVVRRMLELHDAAEAKQPSPSASTVRSAVSAGDAVKARVGRPRGVKANQADDIPHRSELPGWPRGLHVGWAAAYVGLSATSFRVVARDDGLSAVWLTPGRKVYLREDLDAWLDRKAGRSAQTVYSSWDDL